MNTVRLTVHQGKDGQWYGRVQSRNGRILLSSEGYTRKRDAVRGMAKVAVALLDTLFDWPWSSSWGYIAHEYITVVER